MQPQALARRMRPPAGPRAARGCGTAVFGMHERRIHLEANCRLDGSRSHASTDRRRC